MCERIGVGIRLFGLGVLSWALGLGVMAHTCELAASPWPTGVERAAAQLRSPARGQRLLAVRALSSLSPALARAGIERALVDEDESVRRAAAHVALNNGYDGLAARVESWLLSQSALDRILAARLLGKHADAARTKTLATLLSDPERQVRTVVVEVLGQARVRHAALASNLLLGGLDDSEPRVRAAVARALGRLGQSESALPLAGHLADPEAAVREEIARSLGALGDSSVAPALMASLGDLDDAVVAAAVRSLKYLHYEPAVFALLALVERPSFDEVAREAMLALGSLGSSVALEGLMKKVQDPQYQEHLLPALQGHDPEQLPALRACLEESAAESLLICMRLWLGLGGDPQLVLLAERSNRIALGRVLEVLTLYPTFEATVLALEALRSADEEARAAARLYLYSQPSLPKQAGAPLAQALRVAQASQERALLLELLTRVTDWKDAPLSRAHLRDDDDAVARAAGGLLVASAVAGAELERVLSDERAAPAEGALRQLSRGMDLEQADTLVRLIASGRSGRTGLLLDTLWAMPDGISPEVEQLLLEQLRTVNGSARDAILEGLVHGRTTKLIQLLPGLDRADRLKLGQLASLHPEGSALAESLLEDADSRVVALAIQHLGKVGRVSAVLAAYHEIEQRGSRPSYLTAVALHALASASRREPTLALPASALSDEHCNSSHLGTFLASQVLAYSTGQACDEVSLVDLLQNDGRDRVRLAIAQTLGRVGKLTPELRGALRRCDVYEERHDVAELCRAALSPKRSLRKGEGPALQRRPAQMRFRLVPTWLSGDITLYPALLDWRSEDDLPETWMVVSDRRGLVLLPAGTVVLKDAALAF